MLLACYIIWSLNKYILINMTEIIWDMTPCLLINRPKFWRRLLTPSAESSYHWSEQFLDVLQTYSQNAPEKCRLIAILIVS